MAGNEKNNVDDQKITVIVKKESGQFKDIQDSYTQFAKQFLKFYITKTYFDGGSNDRCDPNSPNTDTLDHTKRLQDGYLAIINSYDETLKNTELIQ